MQLVCESSKLLKTPCENINFDSPQIDLDETIASMKKVMKDNDGVGLAASQVGLLYNLFIMENDGKFTACINPEIFTWSDETIFYEEGCLSFPNLRLKIKRSELITCKWHGVDGREYQDRLHKLNSRIFQHECDHLQGITFRDRASKLKLKMAEKKRTKHYGR